VLQPFVENALKHGVLHERTGNEIAIAARGSSGWLELTVRDDGRGLGATTTGPSISSTPPTCVGIANARARLERMYGPEATLGVSDAVGGGVEVRVMLPLSRAGGAAAAPMLV
jgi:sensor histidine kinase YesM